MRHRLLITFITIISYTGFSQDYTSAIGYRGGLSHGFQFKTCNNEINAQELLLSFRRGGMQLTGLIEFHEPAPFGNSSQFFWYYGFGAHIGYHKTYRCYDCSYNDSTGYHYNIYRSNTLALGVDVIGGLEYRVLTFPFTVGAEWKPFIGFFGPRQIASNMGDFAITVKYTFE